MPKGMSKSTAIIQRLLEERRQYEAWIARLNSSADATPGNVRARAREDYAARLVAVMDEPKAHAESARLAIQEKRYMRGELQKREAAAADETGPGGRARVHQVGHRGRHGGGSVAATCQRCPVPAHYPVRSAPRRRPAVAAGRQPCACADRPRPVSGGR